MRTKRPSLFVVVLALVALSSTGGPPLAAARRPTLRSLVVQALRDSTARRIAVAVEADGVGPLVSIGGTRWSRPASTQKLYTSLVALLQLGPSHRPVTEIFRTGRVTRGGTLAGDLELAGPAGLLSPHELETLARNVARRGIRRVSGGLSASAGDDAARPEPGLRGLGDVIGRLAGRLMRPSGAAVTDLAAARRFRTALEAEGVRLRGPIRVAPGPSRVRVRVTRWTGPSVLQLVWVALKSSDNLAAERLLRMTGSSIGDPTTAGGLRVVKEWEERLAVPAGRHGDGSGRSTLSRHTAWNEVAWLRAATRTPVASFFRLSLPVACQGGGTLSYRMCRTPAEGRVFAKTGNVRGVVTLAGYALARSGREVRFSFMLSGVRSKPAARRAIDRALVRIIRYA